MEMYDVVHALSEIGDGAGGIDGTVGNMYRSMCWMTIIAVGNMFRATCRHVARLSPPRKFQKLKQQLAARFRYTHVGAAVSGCVAMGRNADEYFLLQVWSVRSLVTFP